MGGHGVKLGVLLPTRGLIMAHSAPTNADLILKMAHMAEESGLDSVWVGDSLTAKPRLEPLTTLAAVAARTQRVRLGTAVLLAALRHPVLLAQMMGTLDLISGGRTVLAVGAGGAFNREQKQEWEVAGVKASQRGRRLEEVVEIMKRLGTEHTVSFQGRHFQMEEVSLEPRPVQPGGVPVLFACHLRAQREVQFQRAARLGDGYISISETPQDFAEVGRRIKKYAEEYGRDLHRMERVFYMTVNLNRDLKKAQEEADQYLKMYYGINMWQDLWGPWGPPERLVESIQQYAEAGATTVIVRFASFDPMGQFDTFLEEVVSRIQ